MDEKTIVYSAAVCHLTDSLEFEVKFNDEVFSDCDDAVECAIDFFKKEFLIYGKANIYFSDDIEKLKNGTINGLEMWIADRKNFRIMINRQFWKGLS